MRLVLVLLGFLTLVNCGTSSPRPEIAPAAYLPGELLVRGNLETLGYESSGDPDDLLGHGWFSAKLHISKVLRGSIRERVISVRYFAHSSFAPQPSRPIRLYRDQAGNYFICAQPEGSGYRCPSEQSGS